MCEAENEANYKQSYSKMGGHQGRLALDVENFAQNMSISGKKIVASTFWRSFMNIRQIEEGEKVRWIKDWIPV